MKITHPKLKKALSILGKIGFFLLPWPLMALIAYLKIKKQKQQKQEQQTNLSNTNLETELETVECAQATLETNFDTKEEVNEQNDFNEIELNNT